MEFDLLILGAGSGGYEAALYAHRRGLKVALVELSPDTVGGNCLNKGCIPSKYMRHGAYIIDKIKMAKAYGIEVNCDIRFNFEEMILRRDDVVKTIRKNFQKFAKQIGIPIFYGKGVLKDINTVKVDGKTISAGNILIATGSSPTEIPGIKTDGKRIFNTDQIWNLEYIPKSILIVGGGAAGVEFAYIWNAYGSEVTLVELKERILPFPGIPEDSSRYLTRKLTKLGVSIKTRTYVKEVKEGNGKLITLLSDGTILTPDIILVTVGRKPNTEDIGLEEVGVEKDERGFLKVDDFSMTNIEGIYACGDITSPLMLAHKSMYEGKIAVNHILGDKSIRRDESIIPKIIYSAFEVASVGLTEDEAEDQGYDVLVGVSSFVFNPKAMDDSENEGFVRIVVDERSEKILGCHICGPHAGELIHQVLHIMKADISYRLLTETVFAHPSLSEAIGQSALDVKFGPITWIKKR